MPPPSSQSSALRDAVLQMLRERGDSVVFTEFRAGTGSGSNSERYFDVMAIGVSRSSAYLRTVYEIKVSRSDFKREILDPEKSRMARYSSNLFYFVTPPGLVLPEELPDWAGLLEIGGPLVLASRTLSTGQTVRVVRQAPEREAWPPTKQFLASLAIRVSRAEESLEEEAKVLRQEKMALMNQVNRLEAELEDD